MYLNELADSLREDNSELERLVLAHNCGNAEALNDLSSAIIERIQAQIRSEYGDTVTLYHGSDVEITNDINWRENSSFTDEFDIEFAGEDGWIVEAKVPVERIKFYLSEESEFVITAGQLVCSVYTVTDYFGLE